MRLVLPFEECGRGIGSIVSWYDQREGGEKLWDADRRVDIGCHHVRTFSYSQRGRRFRHIVVADNVKAPIRGTALSSRFRVGASVDLTGPCNILAPRVRNEQPRIRLKQLAEASRPYGPPDHRAFPAL